ncbi:nucleotidyltransferase domain-containing protein [Weissella confusa]|uniref:Nucleotidyltransferase domain-containing protein n=1 Tax=Weissella confusa TaxID=1583 RepID=A0A923NHB7_WEICO|nr:nucleotidyltransferase domain-containing protein [Weissella confusa]
MIYETKQIAELIHPILDKYNVQKVVLFGSYAKGEASDKSDVVAELREMQQAGKLADMLKTLLNHNVVTRHDLH